MVSIIIGTHGKFSSEILNSAKTICGEQDNIVCLAFEQAGIVFDGVSFVLPDKVSLFNLVC
ncbi:hypothetical protein P22_3964 [Propionispora sp. 2/2-37]|uniref:hypothetical protein n=1 Tax=Propionispora sp. 2/2-37 TaxID=1677858 RepID=UPI0006BB65F4|nr:hypothetical protein [Propionispora sp. 2/2-37]CUH97818.1 hypothetical protein P22_3964 [Propionispora sp. 2/2-37]